MYSLSKALGFCFHFLFSMDAVFIKRLKILLFEETEYRFSFCLYFYYIFFRVWGIRYRNVLFYG